MTQTPENAVFLSYASGDADAVQQVVDALRAGGVEVWFDRLELVGGDAWDRKIRQQINDCALFIPVLSSNTQARREGYFRLEWHLAEQRSLLIAKGQPFIVPVSLDGIREKEALVPDSFTAVQWTPLTRGEVPPAFVARIQRLLARRDDKATPVANSGMPQTIAGMGTRSRRSVQGAWAIAALCVVVLVAAIQSMVGNDRSDAKTAVQQSPPTATSRAVEGRFIAVLPFESRDDDEATAKSNEVFTDGVHESILSQLSNIPDLRVVSRRSVMQYRGNSAGVPQIQLELGVSHILEGSVQRIGNVVQVNAQLIDALTDTRLWAKSFKRNVNDIFAIQAELALAIAAELKTVLTLAQKEKIERLPTENKEALALFINASQMSPFTEQQSKAAVVLLEQAVKLDPKFALAFVRLAQLHYWRNSRESSLNALGYAKKAVELDPKSALAQQVLATSNMSLGHLDAARIGFQRATELDPNFSAAMNDLSVLEATSGRLDQSFYWANRSMPLAPNLTTSYYHLSVPLLLLDTERARQLLQVGIEKFSAPNRPAQSVHRLHIWLAAAELYGGQPEAAIKRFEALVAEQPDNMEVRAAFAEVCWLTRRDCAPPQVDFFLNAFPDARLTTQGYSARTLQAYLWQQSGQDAQAQPLVVSTIAANEKAIEAGDRSFGPAYENAALSHMKGDREGALTWLEHAVDAGFSDPYAMAMDPILAPLADEPRFKQLLERLHENVRDMRTRVDFSEVDALIAAANQASPSPPQ